MTRIALLVLGLICMLLALASTVLGDPSKENTPAAPGQSAAPGNPAASADMPPAHEPAQTAPPAGKDLSAKELRLVLEPVFDDNSKVTEPRKPETSAAKAKKDPKQGFIARVIEATKGLVNKALSFAGVRYRWGGSSRKGIDCSGLTRLIYLDQGIRLPHNAKAQFKLGKPVPRKDVLPGDLVFFNTRGPLSHVGLYIGNGKFIHAANPRRGVRVDYLSTPYYANRFAGARRYKNFG